MPGPCDRPGSLAGESWWASIIAGPAGCDSLLAAMAAATVLTAGSLGGAVGLVALAVGLLLLDVAVQCGQVANQARIFALRPEARNRLNTGYMTCAFLGGSAGSWPGTRAYVQLGWGAVCALIAVAAFLALAAYLVGRRGQRSDRNTRSQPVSALR